MSLFDFDYNAYHQQLHGVQDDASPANSDTEADHYTGSSRSDPRWMSAVLEGLRGLGVESPEDDGPQIGRSSFAGSTRMDGRVRRDDMFHGTRHHHVSVWRTDAPEAHDLTVYQPLPEHTDEEVTRHTGAGQEAGSSGAAAPGRGRGLLAQAGGALGHMAGTSSSAQGANVSTSRRRARDTATEEVQPRPRYIAGSVMKAEETTLPPADSARRDPPHLADLALLGRAREALKASGVKKGTRDPAMAALLQFSAWLRRIGKPAMQDRLFTEELTLDAQKFLRVKGHQDTPYALDHLRNMESSTHGTTQISTREVRREKKVPDADRLYVEVAFGEAPVSQAAPAKKTSTEAAYRLALLSFSEWLASMDQPGLTAPNALHSDPMTALASEYVSMGLPYGHNVMAALVHLRHFDLNGTVNIKRLRNTLNIPAVDQRLIERFRAQGNAKQEAAGRESGKRILDKKGRPTYDAYAGRARSFSAWLQEQGMRNIASRLDDDFQSLEDDLHLFPSGQKENSVVPYRTALRQLRAMFSKAPEVTIARIKPSRFVDALRMFSANARVADVARETGANEDDLRVFLDEESDTGLTEAGQAVVNGLDGRLRRAADANIALRVQSREQATQHMGQMPTQTPSPYHLSPMSPSAFPNFSGLDDPPGYSQHAGQSGSAQQGAESIDGGLGSLESAAHYGGYGAYPDTPQEVTQQPNTVSPFQVQAVSPLNSAAHYGSHGAPYPSTPSDVAGPSRPGQAGQPLPVGPLRRSLRSTLSHLNRERGFASGDALNCLIDTALQLSTTGVRRPDHGQTPMPGLDQRVRQWRQYLFAAGVVPEHGMIDLYSASRAGQDLAHNLKVRIQIIQWENGRATAHPVLGLQGPLVHILHTPDHFQPLWPRNG